ncbi:MAG: hypothetical protein GVY13_11260 [Alphaproteobacteria bacterium]|jgi:hypothetical protein|nr:hypothetical protein [Alphaproteobacteria bacterium]
MDRTRFAKGAGRLLPALAILLAGLGMAAAAKADSIVLESSAAGLVPGVLVAAGTAIDVPAGGTAVFLTQAGIQVAVEGPYSGPVPEGDGDLPAGWESLIGGNAVDMRDVGASRAIETE